MIEIDFQLLSSEALDTIMMEFITRHSTNYDEKEVDVANKKRQLILKLEQGAAVIVYSSKEGYCTIISLEEKQKIFALKESE
ncbi:MAG: YheU family protein [Tatlockia sp.]|nr:YheU family protein [Tatlockia sp.]